MVKSFKGNALKELDEEVNKFLEEHTGSRVINFVATQNFGAVPKPVYIYIVEYMEDKVEKVEPVYEPTTQHTMASQENPLEYMHFTEI